MDSEAKRKWDESKDKGGTPLIIITLSISLSTPSRSLSLSLSKIKLVIHQFASISPPSELNSQRKQMGLEILEEFMPITPIRTVVPTTKAFNKHDLGTTKEAANEDDEECHTPTSPSQKLTTPLVCPPAPKKPRVVSQRHNLDTTPSEGFFKLQHDLASVFVLGSPNFPRRTPKQALF
ncbi:hypothetical protein VNO78_03396 [Psophocarpus tetragonolobus]|uniref:Uncharacterized protein n=1 Tax=Psophocarpus tetragonolobus TaxID=3891 RepID=A0AAN9T0H0_PSOTE